jgi:UPF0755 protein
MVLAALVVIGGAAGGAWLGLKPLIASWNAPTDYPGPGTGTVQVKIPEGASGTKIGDVLQKGGVVLTVKGFVKAFDAAQPRSAGIKPGTYQLKLQMTSTDAVGALLDDANRLVSRLTLTEGFRVADLPGLIAAKTKIPQADVDAALKAPASIGLPAEAAGNPEGWLFPATYDVEPGITATALLGQMVEQTVVQLNNLGVPEAQRQNVLILASLVQAEAKLAPDFPKIATVLKNRLAAGMKLQLDTTVHYATKDFKVATTIKDTQINSPYNTYLVPGLPIGPIGNPGSRALNAVMHPTPGTWLYFVAVNPDTGETKYATTAKEFALIEDEYHRWAAAHPGR